MADSDSESVELDQGGELDQDGGGSDWSDDDASDEEDVSEKPLGERVRAAEDASVARARAHAPSRKSKNHPMELSSKRRVGTLRDSSALGDRAAPARSRKRGAARDPRFEDACGRLDGDAWRREYDFLDAHQQREIGQLEGDARRERKRARKGRGGAEAAHALREQLVVARQQRLERVRGEKQQAQLREWKRDERAKVAAGKAPFYLKRSAKREMAMQLRFDELRKRGKLDTFMEKKRKKATAKERRWMPTERRGAVGDD